MKKNIFHNALSPLLMCSFILSVTSCADDDLTSNQNNGTLVHFNVNDVQESAISRGAQTRGAITPGLGSSDLAGRKLAARCNRNIDVCLIETTVEGVDPVKADTRTRANIITDATLGDFSASGIRGVGPTSILTTPEWFHAEKTKKTGELYSPILWTFAQPYARFFAVYPNVESYSKMTVNNTAVSGSPSVEFEVETDVTKEVDLMTACSGNVRYATLGVPPETNLNFRHALTGIHFAVGQNLSWNKTIDRVELQGVLLKSKYVLSKELDGTGAAWDHTGYTTRGNAVLSGVSVSTSQNPNVIIMGKNADNYTFYMIPQELTGHVTAYVHFTDGTTITVPLKGKWKAGTTRTYKISQTTSSWQYTFYVMGPWPSPMAYNATTSAPYIIMSYREDPATHEKQAVAWKIVGYDANKDNNYSMEEKPDWLTNLSKESGDGDPNAAEAGVATVRKDVKDLLALRNEALQKATPLGTASAPYDLSTKGGKGSRSTANCYVISAPGYYCIPLVYGNAIKNGSDNPSSYKTSNTGTDILSNFKDHLNHNITTPYINVQNASAPATQASIVWTDKSGIVDGLSVTGSGANAFVNVHVPADKIKNGNAVISVKDASGTVMWSWQLWFAPQDVLTTVKCYNWDNKVFNFTKENLGWQYTKWEGTTYSSERSVRVKVEQTAGNGFKQIGYFDIAQAAYSVRQGYNTVYQFGRKDAMPNYVGVKDGNLIEDGGNHMSIPNSIKHPETFYTYGTEGINNYNYINVWAMNAGVTPTPSHVDKTIYDPCPVGFRVPDGDAFTGFSHDFGFGFQECKVSFPPDYQDYQNRWGATYDATIYLPSVLIRNGCPAQWFDYDWGIGQGELIDGYSGYWQSSSDIYGSYIAGAFGHEPSNWGNNPHATFPKSCGLHVRPISE